MTPRLAARYSRRVLLVAATGAAATAAGTLAQSRPEVESILAGLSLRERVARMFMVPVSGTALTAEEQDWLRELRPGGVILVQQNFGSAADVRGLTTAIHATAEDLPPLVALDEEGGIVTRLYDDPAPDAPTMASLPLDQITTFAHQRAELLASYGFDVNFAPVADVAFTPDSFMAGRTFGDDAAQVADRVVAYLAGTRGTGVLHCVKHFPGHGRVSGDSHEVLPVLDVDEATWEAADALPFVAAVAAGVPMVMLGHLAVPMWDGLPATLSPGAVRVLREGLGFGGVIVTDDLFMGALSAWGPLEIIDLAVAAGVDLLLYVGVPDAPAVLVDHLVARVEQGHVSEDRVTESARRIVSAQLASPA